MIWSRRALADLREKWRFYADMDQGEVAAKAVDAIRTAANRLKTFPQAGRPAEDLEPEHRELLVPFGASGYVIFYEAIDDSVVILSIKHQKEAGY